MDLTISVLKADVGSIGGHTKPSDRMMDAVRAAADKAIRDGLLIDAYVGHTGDDICITATHTRGDNDEAVHQFAWNTFLEATEIARQFGLYGAGQDLLVDAPSGNIRGAGPAVAEVTFDHDPIKTNPLRPAESFFVLAADKCGPGAYNLPMFLGFADPMYCAGLMLPRLGDGFTFNIIDMDNTDGDSIISLNAPEDYYKITVLLRDNERFAIESIVSRYSGQTAAAISATRLHNIAGSYTGKDDPVAVVRNQGIFPAPEELISPYTKAHFIGGRRAGFPRDAPDAGAHQHRGYGDVLPAAGVLRGLQHQRRGQVRGILHRLLRQPGVGLHPAGGPGEGHRHALAGLVRRGHAALRRAGVLRLPPEHRRPGGPVRYPHQRTASGRSGGDGYRGRRLASDSGKA